MGFTHYYYHKNKLDKVTFGKFAKDVAKIIEASKVKVQYECDDDSAPITNMSQVRFNGVGEAGHETFVINRVASKEALEFQRDYDTKPDKMLFNFCKTARKPYDELVVASLILFKLYFRGDVKLGSDGDVEDWVKGLNLVNTRLNLEVTMGTDGAEFDDSIRLANWDKRFPVVRSGSNDVIVLDS
jgi:hypothetical protein